MIKKKIAVRTVAREWYSDHINISCVVYQLSNDNLTYEQIIEALSKQFRVKDTKIDSKTTVFEFERRGFVMDVYVNRRVNGKANVSSIVVCHFAKGATGKYRVSINKLQDNDTQAIVQDKFPEIFDNKTVYWVHAEEFPAVSKKGESILYRDEGGITTSEFSDKMEAIEAARILAKELAHTKSNCVCITVIQGIEKRRSSYTPKSHCRRERDVFTISTKSIGETIFARRKFRHYPLIVDEYVGDEVKTVSPSSDIKYIYILTIAINEGCQFILSTHRFDSINKAKKVMQDTALDWIDLNESKKHYDETFEYKYTIETPELIEIYSKKDNKRLTILLSSIPFVEK